MKNTLRNRIHSMNQLAYEYTILTYPYSDRRYKVDTASHESKFSPALKIQLFNLIFHSSSFDCNSFGVLIQKLDRVMFWIRWLIF